MIDRAHALETGLSGGHFVCDVLINSDILTANYGVKQSQFTKPTSDPALVTLKNLMRHLTRD